MAVWIADHVFEMFALAYVTSAYLNVNRPTNQIQRPETVELSVFRLGDMRMATAAEDEVGSYVGDCRVSAAATFLSCAT